MKRLLSLILAIVMLISLFPAAFAEDNEGITIKYDISGIIKASAKGAASSAFTEELTNGFFRYVSGNGTATKFGSATNYIKLWKANKVVFEVYVPVAGTYTMNINHAMAKTLTGASVYVNDAAEAAGHYDCYDADAANDYSVYKDSQIEGVTLNEGWNTIKFVADNVTGQGSNASIGSFTLSAGSGDAIMGFRTAAVSTGAQVKIDAYLSSTGQKVTEGLTYSSDNEDIATVSTDGTVTGISEGTATITVGGSGYIPLDITVQVSDARNLTVKYDLSGVIKSGPFEADGSGNKRPITDMDELLTHGFFRFNSASGTKYLTHTDMRFRWFGSRACYLEVKKDKWVAFDIYVPLAGTYTMNINHVLYKSFDDISVYVNGSQTAAGTYSCYKSDAENQYTYYETDTITGVELNAGWNTVKFEASGNNPGSVGSFEVVSGNGDGSLLMGAEIIFDDILATVRGINSDGTTADISGADIVWSSDDEAIAKIDAKTGEIEEVNKGTAKIFVSVYIDEENKAETSAEFEVLEPPAPIRDFAGIENSSIIKFINITPEWDPYTNENQGMSDAVRKEDVRGITKDYTDGLWEWYGTSPDVTAGPQDAIVWRYSGVEVYDHRLRLSMDKNKWMALKVQIPAAGRYAVSFEYSTFTSAGTNEVYFIPVTPLDEIDSKLNRRTRLGTFDYFPDVKGPKQIVEKFVNTFQFESGGEYLIVFKNISDNGKSGYLTPRKLILDGVNAFKRVEVSVDDADKTLGYKDTTQMSVFPYLADGTLLSPEDYSVTYESTNESVATVDTSGKITAVGDGAATITAIVTSGGETHYESVEITAIDDTKFLGAVLEIPEELYVRETAKMDFYASMQSGNKVRSIENVTYSYSEDGIVEIADGGVVNALREGNVRVTASGTFRGSPVSDFADISVVLHPGKQEPTIHTTDRRNAALENIGKYSWAKSTMKSAVSSADQYLDRIDIILNQLSNDGWPRSRQMGLRGDTTYNLCKYCSYDVAGNHGYNGEGGWTVDILSRPWKVQCPDCKRLFPSNDFESFYELGFDENGIWSRQTALDAHRAMLIEKGLLADTGEEAPTEDRSDAWYKYYGYGVEGGYLYNETYPELWKEGSESRNIDPRTGDEIDGLRWGVDDSQGYYPGRKVGTIDENHCYIPYYSYFMLSQARTAIDRLANAYLYTGDIKYGRAGAILLDRFADIYPSYDIYQYNVKDGKKTIMWTVTCGGSGYGKIQGRINDSGFATTLAMACDALYPALNDAGLINYLSEKNPEKSSSVKIWENWENGILKEIFKGAKTGQIKGNFGSPQETVATAAIVLDKEPETTEMIEWIYAANTGDANQNIQGSELGLSLTNRVDRDGMCDEAAPYYQLNMWLTKLYTTAERLALYKGKENYNLYENPKFVKLFESVPSLVLAESHIAQIGDTGATAGLELVAGKDLLISAFKNLKNTEYAEKIARYLWLLNGKSTEGLRYGIFEKNPESLEDEISALIDENKETESEMMAGYGFAVLRAGKNYASASSATANNNQRDFWMYFGRNNKNASHGHADTLNIGIEAFGLNLSPDIGYPANTGSDPQRVQWVAAALSHNTAVVDGKDPKAFISGYPLHFDDTENVKLVDVDASEIYDETETFRRSIVMVKVNDDISYGVDFFRINGGNTHTFSFHAQSEKAEAINGVAFTPDEVVQDENGKDIKGSYQGADVPQGQDPNTRTDVSTYETLYPRGNTWLYDVRRDKAPEKNFTVDFAITDYRKAIANNKNIHLRVTQLNSFSPSEIALAKGPVPTRKQNAGMPEGLEYMLVQRRGENLDSLFTTVYEPYRETRYIESIEALAVDGVAEGNNAVKAVKVTHTGGERFDYIVYSTDNSKTFTVRDTDGSAALTFRGFVGVVSKNADGAVTYRYVTDGDEISGASGKAASYKGVVTGFEKEISFDNYIDVIFDGDVNLSDIEGRYINIANNADFNGAYLIKSVTDNRETDGTVRLGIGDVTLINSYKDDTAPENGFNFNIKEEQTFVIPTSFEEDFSPIFDDVSDNITTSAGSSVSVTVNAQSPITDNPPAITYVAATLPRGASLNSATGTVTWKPDASQIGENHFAITARDADGRESTVHFTITVYGSTTGSSSKNENESTDNSGSSGDTTTPSGGGGGGGGATDDKPENDAGTEQTDTSDKTETEATAPDASGETDNIRFTDLGNHEWAEDAINTLAQNGIIRGTTSNTYSPAKNITRADFASLLVRAFELSSDNTENFADVQSGDYFATELAIARNTGIVNGIGDNKYAPRNHITRQDMMVIVYRALEASLALKGGGTEGDGGIYTDFTTIAPYARDAVSALIGAGLVNGKNNLIAPNDYTTRAEVAVLLKRILDFINTK